MIEDLRQRLLRHIRFLESELSESDRFTSLTMAVYLKDSDRRRSVERWAENIVNSIIDIAKIVVTLERIQLADSYRGIISSVSSVDGFSDLPVDDLSSSVRLRNILAHEYLDVRWNSLERFIREKPPQAREFLLRAKEYLRRISLEAEGQG